MSRYRVGAVIVILGLAVLFGGILLIQNNATTPVQLVHKYSESPTAFSFQYPDGWQYSIPQLNLLVLGPPEVFTQMESAPTFTIQRSETLFFEGGLDEALDAYLRRGPLRPNRQWEVLGDIAPRKVDDRDALTVELQGSEFPDWPKLRMRITAVAAENKVVYIFVASSPVGEWDRYRPTLDAVLESVEIYE